MPTLLQPDYCWLCCGLWDVGRLTDTLTLLSVRAEKTNHSEERHLNLRWGKRFTVVHLYQGIIII